MRTFRWLLLFGFPVLFRFVSPALGDEFVGPEERAAQAAWVKGTLLSTEKPVISFRYGGKSSADLLPSWNRAPLVAKTLSDGRTQYRLEWTDPATGLDVRVEAEAYGDYPAVQWTAYLKNTGTQATPIVEDLEGIDTAFAMESSEAVLRTTQGDNFSPSSYEPLAFALSNEARSFHPTGGRPTNGAWPYYNIDFGKTGILFALGWPGQWQTHFARDKASVRVTGGQEKTHLSLNPGEEIRTPLVALVFWKGEDWIAGQNLWRHWFVAHIIPRPDGKPPGQISAICDGSRQTIDQQKALVDSYVRQGEAEKVDYLWIDAGWYEGVEPDWAAAKGLGTWKADPIRFPHGIREISDYVHSKGMKLVLWFEPERVYRGSYVWDNHPEWLLSWSPLDIRKHNNRLLNLGDPAARAWITDTVSHFISEQGVDLYRQDFNVDPLEAWRNHDTSDRQGMTENLYVQGYLAYWDALLSQHPGLLIDSCASGGRRNDLETLRRAVPLYRSDYEAPQFHPLPPEVCDGNQGQTYGLSLWVPYYGSGEYGDDLYSARSQLCPSSGLGTRPDNPNWPAFAKQITTYRRVADYFYGDYYPLTAYSKDRTVWMAWEFVRPGQGDGMIEAFRREECPNADTRLKLHHLKPDARYDFTDLDSGRTTRLSGTEAMADGLSLNAPASRSALIVTFKQAP
jgi:alpha-galactosidase